MRPRCLWAWLTYIAALATAATTFFVALASTTAAVVVTVISAILALMAIGIGAQLITAVNDDHLHRITWLRQVQVDLPQSRRSAR